MIHKWTKLTMEKVNLLRPKHQKTDDTTADAEQSISYTSEQQEMVKAVQEAHNEWQAAQSYFDNATDPELIDHAILSIVETERKYMYLLNKAKQMGLYNRVC